MKLKILIIITVLLSCLNYANACNIAKINGKLKVYTNIIQNLQRENTLLKIKIKKVNALIKNLNNQRKQTLVIK